MRRVKGKMREENNLKRKGREITGKPDERGWMLEWMGEVEVGRGRGMEEGMGEDEDGRRRERRGREEEKRENRGK